MDNQSENTGGQPPHPRTVQSGRPACTSRGFFIAFG